MVTITLDEKQAEAVVKMCENELHYKIHESACCCQYEPEINALLLILKSLDEHSYNEYSKDFEEQLKSDKDRGRW